MSPTAEFVINTWPQDHICLFKLTVGLLNKMLQDPVMMMIIIIMNFDWNRGW